jgi:hypothetical protein
MCDHQPLVRRQNGTWRRRLLPATTHSSSDDMARDGELCRSMGAARCNDDQRRQEEKGVGGSSAAMEGIDGEARHGDWRGVQVQVSNTQRGKKLQARHI